MTKLLAVLLLVQLFSVDRFNKYTVILSGYVGLLTGYYAGYKLAGVTDISTKIGEKIITCPLPLWGKVLLALSGAGYGYMTNKMLFKLK